MFVSRHILRTTTLYVPLTRFNPKISESVGKSNTKISQSISYHYCSLIAVAKSAIIGV